MGTFCTSTKPDIEPSNKIDLYKGPRVPKAEPVPMEDGRKKELNNFFDAIDKDQNGFISYAELMTAWRRDPDTFKKVL